MSIFLEKTHSDKKKSNMWLLIFSLKSIINTSKKTSKQRGKQNPQKKNQKKNQWSQI